MQICIATPILRKNDGQGRVNLEIAKEALRRGYSLRCVTEEIDGELACNPRVTWHKVHTRLLPTQLLRSIAGIVLTSLVLARRRAPSEFLLANGASFVQRADIVAIHFLHSSWLASPYHGSKAGRGLRRAYYWLYDRLHTVLERLAVRAAHHAVAVSEAVRSDLQEVCSRTPVTVIPNGVDVDEFADRPPERAQFGLPQDKVIALFAGDLRTPRKNLDTVLQALRYAPDVVLAVAGSSSRSHYPELAARMGLADRVRFLDFQQDMSGLMRSADIVVFPSHYDPFGLVALEGCASSRPVIVSRAAGVSAVLHDGAAIVLDRSDDPRGLAAALSRLAASPDLRQRMGEAGRRIALDLSWRAIAARWVDLIEHIAASKTRIGAMAERGLVTAGCDQ
jgi:glycosyltransferase involved in cell wall biosynthesis